MSLSREHAEAVSRAIDNYVAAERKSGDLSGRHRRIQIPYWFQGFRVANVKRLIWKKKEEGGGGWKTSGGETKLITEDEYMVLANELKDFIPQ